MPAAGPEQPDKESKVRKKIFHAFLKLSVGLLLALSAAAVLIHQFLKTQDEIKHLENFGTIISTAINKHGWDFLRDGIDYEWVRITLINSDGTILYDSEVEEKNLDNHLNRAEVEAALHTGYSTSKRFSDTLQKQTFYHAIKLDSGQVLRLSFTSDSLYLYTKRFTIFLILMMIMLTGGCYYVATLLSRSIIEPINRVNLNDIRSLSDPGNHTYTELQPFLWRIGMQQHKIDEQFHELRIKTNEFQAITKSMSDGLVVLNAKGNIVSINKIARKIFDVTKENCINQSYKSIDNSEYMQEMMSLAATDPRQTRSIVRDGRDYDIRFSKISDNGVCLGYVLIIFDVTEKKRTEQIRQEFTANVSHELKTPLQSIIGYSEMMANGFVQSDDIKHFASRIHKQSSRLKTLIEDIIFLSHLDEGQLSIMEDLSITSIAHEVFENLQEKAQERHVQLQIRGDDIKMVAVNRYIYELIYNLVDNAIRYNRENGSVTITLHTTSNKYMISVADTGIGIAPEEQHRVFERFYRVDKSHSRQTGGTGLGLSIVKRVVLYHHGKIKITSHLNQGTVFSITFYKDKLRELREENRRKHEALLEANRREHERSSSEMTALSTPPEADASADAAAPTDAGAAAQALAVPDDAGAPSAAGAAAPADAAAQPLAADSADHDSHEGNDQPAASA